MAKYLTTTPRDKYTISADNKADARKVVLERENIQLEKITEETPVFGITDLRNKLPYKNSLGKNPKSRINKVIVHHDGQWRPDVYDSFRRYSAQAKYHIGKGYGHISYHFIIDNVGEIFQCLDTDERAYHAGHWWTNLTSIAVKFDGNMDVQPLTQSQKESYKNLMIYLTTKRPDLPKVLKGCEKGHRDVKATACPGKATTDKIIHNY